MIEKVDKQAELGAERFGYEAVHFVVRIGKRSSGARYDDLKGLVCEIQTRTVLQDAWAIIQQHLVYKQEADVPLPVQRRLNRLVGLFELADDEFDHIRGEREAYIGKVSEVAKEAEKFLAQDLNLDTLRAYLQWKFPDAEIDEGELSWLLSLTGRTLYKTLGDVDNLVNKTENARRRFWEDRGIAYSEIWAGGHIVIGQALYDKKFREYHWGSHPDAMKRFERFEQFVEGGVRANSD